jgi:hypothetical protein
MVMQNLQFRVTNPILIFFSVVCKKVLHYDTHLAMLAAGLDYILNSVMSFSRKFCTRFNLCILCFTL